MDACSSCGYEILPDADFCTNCGNRHSRAQAQMGQVAGSPAVATAAAGEQTPAAAASFRNPAVEAVTAQLGAATWPSPVTDAPRGIPHVPPPAPAPSEYRKPPLTIGGWSFFDKVRFRWGGAGDIILGIALIGGGHSAGATIFGLLFIALGIATWVITQFGTRGREQFGDDWYSAWNAMPANGRAIAGTGSVIGVLFLYVFLFWFFIILWVIKNVIA